MTSSAGETPGYWPPGEAGRVLDAREFVIPVLGAGISVAGGLPSSQMIAAHIQDVFAPREGDYSGPRDLMKVADEADADQAELRKVVCDYVSSFEAKPTSFTRSLVRLPSKFIITFSYDLLIEEAAADEGLEYESLANSEDDLERAFSLLFDHGGPDCLTVLHIHGRQDLPDSIVLDAPSYQRLPKRAWFDKLILTLMRRWSMCFIGTRLNELHLVAEMRAYRRDPRHVLLCKEDVRDDIVEGFGLSKERDGVIVATYQEHAALDGFASKLATVSRAAIPTHPVAASEERDLPFGYIANVLEERGHRLQETDRIAAAILGRAYGPEPLGEADVAQGHRTLIVGAPGSGKSELIRKAGELVPDAEFPLLIRCADLEKAAASAEIALEQAAKQGIGLRGDVVVSREALRRRRFHFFLDGLDEKAVGQQEDVAQLIIELADAFPQHRFTVTTRPVDALSVFPHRVDPGGEREEDESGLWRVLELSPGHDWQTRYLQAAEIRLADLEAAMPALADLGELLHLPFFLSKTVELYREDKLTDFEDLWALVQGLVTAALERETEVPLPPDEARTWLRDVALAMHLSGRTSLTLDEIEQVAMPKESGKLVGSAKDIADQLILRFLLQEDGGNYRFAHRIIGEALAAEGLDRLRPEDAIVDAVVPERDEEVRGVRQDWLVPITFLVGRNAEWRQRVGGRDALAAARGVPVSASHGEREAAARTIWDTYCGRKVWIWDYEAPELIEDAEALGRLLRTEGLEGLIEEVRQSIDDASPQIQGNAIRVLSRVNPDGFVDDLRRVLADDDREAVVRRRAAIAARDIQADELLPLIIHRAANPEDSAEAQDCSICAFDLAGDERLVETAMALARSGEARSLALSRFKLKATTEQMVRFLRITAEADPDPYGSEKELFLDVLREVVKDG